MTAAEKLLGLTLNDGWVVVERVDRPPYASGGTFSHSYLAEKNGTIAFVKAFDFSDAFETGVDTLELLNEKIASYEHERDVLEHCRGRRLSNVAVAIGHGKILVPDMSPMEGSVYYLLFEKADRDLRCRMEETDRSDVVWCLRAVRHVCLGLWQVHREFIAHQDLKPSNVLCFDGDGANADTIQVSDFGRSSRRGHRIWHDDLNVPGDQTYAPPELLYGYIDPEFAPRRFGTDLYMLGNFATFVFTGANVTGLLAAHLDPQHHWNSWRSDYTSVLPYLHEAFARLLEELNRHIPLPVRSEMLALVRQLCSPDLFKRGHPRGLNGHDQYSLERYVSQLTNLLRRQELAAPSRSR